MARRSSALPTTLTKRAALLLAGEEQFRLHGVRRTSMESIAAAAKVAKATAYAYFRSKEEVFHAVCASVMERLAAHIDAASQRATAPEPRALAIVEAKFLLLYDIVHRSPHAADLLASSDLIAAEIVERADAHFHRVLRQALIEAKVPARQASELATIIEHGGWGLSELADNVPQLRRRLRLLVSALLAAPAAAD